MKKMLAMLAMAFAVGAAAEDVLVKEFELNLDKDRYVYAAKDQGVKNSFKDGVFTVEVVRNVTPPRIRRTFSSGRSARRR